jgi:hypothetical protein
VALRAARGRLRPREGPRGPRARLRLPIRARTSTRRGCRTRADSGRSRPGSPSARRDSRASGG